MTINYQKRLDLASRIAKFFADNNSNRLIDSEDCGWMIGMVCDTTMSDAELLKEIKHTKENFPEYSSVLNWKDVIYCVWGPEPYEGSNKEVLYKIFDTKEEAEAYTKNSEIQGMRIFETEVG